MDKAYLHKIVYVFTQEGNSDCSTADEEILEVEVCSSSGSLLDTDGYFVLRTDTGWSISSPSELAEILSEVVSGVPNGA